MQRNNTDAANEAAGKTQTHYFIHEGAAIRANKKTNNKPQTVTVRKRHWFLGSLLILSGSWITHTTTATIATPEQTTATPGQTAQQDLISVEKSSFAKESQSPKQTDFADIAKSNANTSNSDLAKSAPVSADAEIAASQEPKYTQRFRTIARGESLGLIFKREGLDQRIPHHIAKHKVAKKLTFIRAGKELEFRLDDSNELKQIRYPVDRLSEFVIKLDGVEVVSAETVPLDYTTQQVTVSAEIQSSLYVAAQKAGLSNNLIMEMVRIFGWDVDFVQDIRSGDSFHLVFEEHVLADRKLDDGNILAAEFTTQGRTYRAIRFEDADGVPSYFNTEGESMLGTFLRSPVEFSRISSRFGKRKHPISKKWKAHKGVDYAAPRGTPIRATADGKVISAGRKGGYGNTVVLRHAGRFSTLYAHMNGFAKGVRAGSRVKQGQIIGYVGSTGMSTGPHLHYEFRVDGVHRNSLTYKTPKASSVSEANRLEFEKLAEQYGRQLDELKQEYLLAKANQGKKQI